jgi:hypothetical protein
MSGFMGVLLSTGGSVSTFTNGSFGTGEFTYNATTDLWTIPGWAIGNTSQVWLNGVSTIQGWPTPTDPDPTPYLSPGERTGSPMTYNFE